MPAIHEVIIRIRGQTAGVAQATQRTRALKNETQQTARSTRTMGASTSTLNKALGKQATAATRVRGGMGTLRSVLGSLGARAVGVTGTLGTMTSAVGFMAIGNLASIGVLGGIGALVFGFKQITKGAREAKERVEALRVTTKQFFDQQRSVERGRLLTARNVAQADFDEASADFVRARILRSNDVVVRSFDKLATTLRESRDALTAARNKLREFDREAGQSAIVITEEDEALRTLNDTLFRYITLLRDAAKLGLSVAAAQSQFTRGPGPGLFGRPPIDFQESEGGLRARRRREIISNMSEGMQQAVRDSRRGMNDAANEMGSTVGFLIAQSIIGALNAVRGGGFFGGALGVVGGIVGFVASGGNPGGAGLGAAIGQTVGGIIDDEISSGGPSSEGSGGVVIVPASINLNVQSADPNMVAQSAVFQTQLREGLRRAEEDGFKFVRISRG